MQRIIPVTVLALGLSMAGASVRADPPPPPNALPLSQILRMVEERVNPAYFDDIEWDDGYWEIEFIGRDGNKRTVRVDPVSGQDRPNR